MIIEIGFGSGSGRRDRTHKGKSLLVFPHDYTVVDIETTGLDAAFDEIIEIGALKVRADEVVDRFSTLVKPLGEIDEFITELTGITNDMVAEAPSIAEVLPSFLEFIGSDVFVGHNAHFDVNFIYDNVERISENHFSNDIVDTLRLSRHILPELKHHTLDAVAEHFGIVRNHAHRGIGDCDATFAVLQALSGYAAEHGIDLSAIQRHAPKVRAADIVATTDVQDPDNVLFGKVCVFTGALDTMTRAEAMQIVVNLGGICGDSVTKKTDYLILGNNSYGISHVEGKSSKQRKAEDLILKGQELQIISEAVFMDIVSEYLSEDSE